MPTKGQKAAAEKAAKAAKTPDTGVNMNEKSKGVTISKGTKKAKKHTGAGY